MMKFNFKDSYAMGLVLLCATMCGGWLSAAAAIPSQRPAPADDATTGNTAVVRANWSYGKDNSGTDYSYSKEYSSVKEALSDRKGEGGNVFHILKSGSYNLADIFSELSDHHPYAFKLDENGSRNKVEYTDTIVADVDGVVFTHNGENGGVISKNTNICFKNITFSLSAGETHAFTSDELTYGFEDYQGNYYTCLTKISLVNCKVNGQLTFAQHAYAGGSTFTESGRPNIIAGEKGRVEIFNSQFNNSGTAIKVAGGTETSNGSLVVNGCAFYATASTTAAPIEVAAGEQHDVRLYGLTLNSLWQASAGLARSKNKYWTADAATSEKSVVYENGFPVWPKDVRFYVGVSGANDQDGNVLSAGLTVFSDYSSELQLIPTYYDDFMENYNNYIFNGKSSIAAGFGVSGVSTLGIDGTKSRYKIAESDNAKIQKALAAYNNFGMTLTGEYYSDEEGSEPYFHDGLASSLYNFKGLNAKITVTDIDGSTQALTYKWSANDLLTSRITGTPSSSSEASKAWHMIAANIKTSSDKNDTHIFIPRGATVTMGNERLVFSTDYDGLDGDALRMSDVKGAVRNEAQKMLDATSIEKLADADVNYNTAKISLPAGTLLGIGASQLALQSAAVITVNVAELTKADKDSLTDIFSRLANNTKTAIKTEQGGRTKATSWLIKIANTMVDMVSGKEATVDISFAAPSPIRYKTKTDDKWSYITPDAEGYYTFNDGDYSRLEITEDIANANVKYVRNISYAGTYYPWYMPFDIDPSQMSGYTFYRFEAASYDKQVTTKPADEWHIVVSPTTSTVKANKPYFFKTETAASGKQTFTFDGVTIKKTVEDSYTVSATSNSFTLKGTYSTKVPGADADGYDWFALARNGFSKRTKGNEQAQAVLPLRFFLKVTGRNVDYSRGISISEDKGNTTGINAAKTAEQTPAPWYTVDGIKVNAPLKSGIYIRGGKKVLVR